VGEGNKKINYLKNLINGGMKGMGDTCTKKNF
jgi:hypothetical protein